MISSYPQDLSLGDTGEYVNQLQYMLRVISSFITDIPSPPETGVFDISTRNAVLAFENFEGLPLTGTVNAQVWDAIYAQFESVRDTVFDRDVLFDEAGAQTDTASMQQNPGETLTPGSADGGM